MRPNKPARAPEGQQAHAVHSHSHDLRALAMSEKRGPGGAVPPLEEHQTRATHGRTTRSCRRSEYLEVW